MKITENIQSLIKQDLISIISDHNQKNTKTKSKD